MHSILWIFFFHWVRRCFFTGSCSVRLSTGPPSIPAASLLVYLAPVRKFLLSPVCFCASRVCACARMCVRFVFCPRAQATVLRELSITVAVNHHLVIVSTSLASCVFSLLCLPWSAFCQLSGPPLPAMRLCARTCRVRGCVVAPSIDQALLPYSTTASCRSGTTSLPSRR